jgi:thiol-disulfide isomerase/thioredoxin
MGNSATTSNTSTTTTKEEVDMSAIRREIERQITSNKVLIYSKTWCGYCQSAKDAVAKLGVSFKAIELDVRIFSIIFRNLCPYFLLEG